MKRILVPIDFSECSMNALAYSVELAVHTKAELVLYHCFYIPEFVHDSVYAMENAEANEKDSWESLDLLKKNILKDHPELKIKTFCSFGITIDEINDQAKAEHANLIVIGAHGAGYLEEKIIGSTASKLISSAVTSVLVIDRHVKFKPLKNIVLATDFAGMNHQVVLKPLKQLVTYFKAHLCILNIYKEASAVPSLGEITASFELDRSLKHVNHTFFYLNDQEIIAGINAFVKKQKMDMVAMIARKHTLLERIFRQPYTKTMTFHSHVPFLVLHE